MHDLFAVANFLLNSATELTSTTQSGKLFHIFTIRAAKENFHYDLRKKIFAPRIVNVWNSLPEIVISADTTDTFKRRLDKFWQHQDIFYIY